MENSFDFFEKIYCINLNHRTDRWENCVSQFNQLGIQNRVERKEATVCAHTKLNRKQNAQVGCALSHYKIFKEAQKNNYSSILILEDDFLFTKTASEIQEEIKKSTEELPKNWDAYYLGGFIVKGYDFAPVENFSNNLIRIKTCFCTHAIGYSINGVNNVLKSLKLDSEQQILTLTKEYEAIDWYFATEWQHRNNCYGPRSLLCVQREGFSDIDQEHGNHRHRLEESYKEYVK